MLEIQNVWYLWEIFMHKVEPDHEKVICAAGGWVVETKLYKIFGARNPLGSPDANTELYMLIFSLLDLGLAFVWSFLTMSSLYLCIMLCTLFHCLCEVYNVYILQGLTVKSMPETHKRSYIYKGLELLNTKSSFKVVLNIFFCIMRCPLPCVSRDGRLCLQAICLGIKLRRERLEIVNSGCHLDSI